MSSIKSTRIQSIDILRGLVMVIMALDHVRDYFHYGTFFSDPTNLDTTTPAVFFTRFITHYCAPVFVFLAGTSAFLYGQRKTKHQLFKFLFTRGLWLILLEIVVNNFIWWFDFTFSIVVFQVIWAIGVSMVVLSLLIYLPKRVIITIGLLIVVGHNAFDGLTTGQGTSFTDIVWGIMHEFKFLTLGSHSLIFAYPILPWIGVITLGYCFGSLYKKDFNVMIRKKWLLYLGFGSIVLFFILRGINIYGDLTPWTEQRNTTYTILSFFNVTKYPPSLSFLLITLGPAMLFLYFIENIQNRITNFLLVYGRVPLLYYFLHVLVIHLVATAGILIFGGDWTNMILTAQKFFSPTPEIISYGYSLSIVYLVWIGVVLLLYPVCKKYMIYKANNRDKWWLSYL